MAKLCRGCLVTTVYGTQYISYHNIIFRDIQSGFIWIPQSLEAENEFVVEKGKKDPIITKWCKDAGLTIIWYGLSARKARIYEAEPLLSLARQFQNMGLDFDSLLPWIESLREQAARGIDFKTAATYMIHEIELS